MGLVAGLPIFPTADMPFTGKINRNRLWWELLCMSFIIQKIRVMMSTDGGQTITSTIL